MSPLEWTTVDGFSHAPRAGPRYYYYKSLVNKLMHKIYIFMYMNNQIFRTHVLLVEMVYMKV